MAQEKELRDVSQGFLLALFFIFYMKLLNNFEDNRIKAGIEITEQYVNTEARVEVERLQ